MESHPEKGVVLWPVGTGDSTTIIIDTEQGLLLQVDLRHLENASDEDDVHVQIIDELKKILPDVDGEPYLAAFLLTHPDQDHCQGFARLLEEVRIGELWFSPGVLSEYKQDLCDDAVAFQEEVERRIAKTVADGEETLSGDRVRIIGYADLLEDEYTGLPDSCLAIPGEEIISIDGIDASALFSAFIHAPFKGDEEKDRNYSSVGIQVELRDGEVSGRVLLLGDLCNEGIKRIFEVTEDNNPEKLNWDVFLAPHHCSKCVMYVSDGDGDEVVDSALLTSIENHASEEGCIVSSSDPVPGSNSAGDNPPHAIAKARYEEIAPGGFYCTQEWPNATSPEPLFFGLTQDGLVLADAVNPPSNSGETELTRAIKEAHGGDATPAQRVGFGA